MKNKKRNKRNKNNKKNILSYFTKDTKINYKSIKSLEYINVYYNCHIIWQLCLYNKTIYNFITNIYKSCQYRENRTSFLFIKNKKLRDSFILEIYSLNKTIIKSKLYSQTIEYMNYKDNISLLIKILNFKGYIYRYRYYRIKKSKIFNTHFNIVFIPNKYELEFCSKLLYLF